MGRRHEKRLTHTAPHTSTDVIPFKLIGESEGTTCIAMCDRAMGTAKWWGSTTTKSPKYSCTCDAVCSEFQAVLQFYFGPKWNKGPLQAISCNRSTLSGRPCCRTVGSWHSLLQRCITCIGFDSQVNFLNTRSYSND